ncbi:MAG: c-type cytochrome [Deltaproteobacteria bacterium]|nr:c-type cytochrome [Deltaproteobacteria bacterium]
MSDASQSPKHHDHKSVYVRVWLALLILTAITVGVAYQDYGVMNIFVAMLIATIKAALVILFFMHLKYDNKFNQVVFLSSFVFLAVFVALTAADLFDRGVERPAIAATPPTAAGGGASAEELNTLRQPTPELVAKGKELYVARCGTCHGEQGRGDGPAGGAFNPPPRNFTVADGWKLGRTTSEVMTAVSKGLAGTPMPPFESTLPLADRFAVTHYVRSFMPDAPADTDESFKKMQDALGLSGGGSAASVRLPVDQVMQLMAVPVSAAAANGQLPAATHPGAPLFAQFCAPCHGAAGGGGVKVGTLGVNPRAYLRTAPLHAATGTWRSDEMRFIELVANGLPGVGKSGITHFTRAEWHELYEYVRQLSE